MGSVLAAPSGRLPQGLGRGGLRGRKRRSGEERVAMGVCGRLETQVHISPVDELVRGCRGQVNPGLSCHLPTPLMAG
jgi:hypothetical protein